jgi:serine/threonine protein kinase/tetratricopeptide (TPR) repeat protein
LIERLNTALAGRYRVERSLGEGGMATVFLARDLRHNRSVALKVLKPDLAAAIGAERFLAEIETTANLQHPNILPLHDSGDADGLLFYTMPYVEGDTLRQRLDRERTMPIDEAIRMVGDIADALEVAHERGIVHRDIKPSNILLSRGKALVADFGIARAAGSADSGSSGRALTQLGTVIGTAGYMSPEQATGSGDVDHRSDVYSLACMLFEMLTGEPPFAGTTILQVLVKQASEAAPPVRTRRAEVPVEVERALTKALAREPRQRFASAGAFATALTAGTQEGPAAAAISPPAPIGAPTKSVVVLPFINRSADPDNEYFSDGLTDEVISDLARVSALRVISRNSAMALKGRTLDTPTLARELGVTHLVTGTVRRAGPSLRVTVELVDASTDSPVWAEKFTGTMEDVFGIQEEISRQIVAALKLTLTATEDHGVAERSIDDPLAYDFYLRASHVMFDWTPDAQSHAMRLIDEAIAISGDVPLLLAMKGQLEWNKVNIPIDPKQLTGSARERAERALADAASLAEQALALDPDSYLAIFVRGLVAGSRGRPEVGLVDLHRAHQLRPVDANVLLELDRYSLAAGLDCKDSVDRLLAIDPLTPQSHLMTAMYYGLYGPVENAAAPARRSIELAHDASLLHVSAAYWLDVSGQRAEAIAVLDRVHSVAPGDLRGGFATFFRCAFEGDAAGAERAATAEMEAALTNEFLCVMMARVYAILGRADDALRLLRRAVELGFINHRALTASRELVDCLGTHPGFEALLAGIEPRWRAVVEWYDGLNAEPRGDAATLLAPATHGSAFRPGFS